MKEALRQTGSSKHIYWKGKFKTDFIMKLKKQTKLQTNFCRACKSRAFFFLCDVLEILILSRCFVMLFVWSFIHTPIISSCSYPFRRRGWNFFIHWIIALAIHLWGCFNNKTFMSFIYIYIHTHNCFFLSPAAWLSSNTRARMVFCVQPQVSSRRHRGGSPNYLSGHFTLRVATYC